MDTSRRFANRLLRLSRLIQLEAPHVFLAAEMKLVLESAEDTIPASLDEARSHEAEVARKDAEGLCSWGGCTEKAEGERNFCAAHDEEFEAAVAEMDAEDELDEDDDDTGGLSHAELALAEAEMYTAEDVAEISDEELEERSRPR